MRLTVFALLLAAPLLPAQAPVALDAAHLKPIAQVSDRFQSFNVEMVEVTGGRFWAPYKQAATGPTAVEDKAPALTPGGMPASLYRYRSPIDLSNPQLRKLAAALGPSYIRVSGTWANTTYFHDSDDPTPAAILAVEKTGSFGECDGLLGQELTAMGY